MNPNPTYGVNIVCRRGFAAPHVFDAFRLSPFVALFSPPCRVRGENNEVDQTRPELEGVLNDGTVNHMRYALPAGFTCDHCILMMRYRECDSLLGLRNLLTQLRRQPVLLLMVTSRCQVLARGDETPDRLVDTCVLRAISHCGLPTQPLRLPYLTISARKSVRPVPPFLSIRVCVCIPIPVLLVAEPYPFQPSRGCRSRRPLTTLIPDSGAGCKSPGYDEFNPPSWPSECAPDKEDWIATGSHNCNQPGRTWGNLFWNCADIAIKSCEKSKTAVGCAPGSCA